ncbi:MAG: hypothetical protein O3A10_11390 [Chloroflexi bacterium]|nr:hypothetical protein [Chloroflexota bacterium]
MTAVNQAIEAPRAGPSEAPLDTGVGRGIDASACEGARAFRVTGAWVLLVGTLTMIAGAVTWASSGLDLDVALADGEVAAYLSDAGADQTVLMWNLSLWTVGVIGIGLGGLLLTRSLPDSVAATVSRFGFMTGVAAAIGFFPLWMGLVLGLGGHPELEPVGVALGQAATIADWIATALILGVGGVGLALAGRDAWVPGWLARVAPLASVLGVVSIASLALDARGLGFVVVPAGFALLLALSVSALRAR